MTTIYYAISNNNINNSSSKIIEYSTIKSFLEEDDVAEKIGDILHNIGCTIMLENTNAMNQPESVIINTLRKHGFSPVRIKSFDNY